MSHYHYEDPYEYEDHGNHGNGNYKYGLYSDHSAPDHWEPEPTPFKPDHYHYEHAMDPIESNHHANCEYDADRTSQGTSEAYRSGYKGEGAYGLGELVHGDNETGEDWE